MNENGTFHALFQMGHGPRGASVSLAGSSDSSGSALFQMCWTNQNAQTRSHNVNLVRCSQEKSEDLASARAIGCHGCVLVERWRWAKTSAAGKILPLKA